MLLALELMRIARGGDDEHREHQRARDDPAKIQERICSSAADLVFALHQAALVRARLHVAKRDVARHGAK